MKHLFLTVLMMVSAGAAADEALCTVEGMHCDGCRDAVKSVVCGSNYEICNVQITGKNTGTIFIKTKLAADLIDKVALEKKITDVDPDNYKPNCKMAVSSKGRPKG